MTTMDMQRDAAPQHDGFESTRQRGAAWKPLVVITVVMGAMFVSRVQSGVRPADALRMALPLYALFVASHVLVLAFGRRPAAAMRVLGVFVSMVALVELVIGVGLTIQSARAPSPGTAHTLPIGVGIMSVVVGLLLAVYARSLFRRAARLPATR